MATVKDVYNFINSFAPFNTAEEWDNSGLLVGDENAEVVKIIFALDCTNDVINQAVKAGANLIITHHPVIFKPVSTVMQDSLVYKLIKNNISIICAHTNYDKAQGGVNDILCKIVGFDCFEKVQDTCLNIGMYDKEIAFEDFVNTVKSKLNAQIRHNNIDKSVKKVAVCSGSGSDYLSLAKELNCDVLLTGDGSHHDFLDANEMGVALVCAGHFETENISIEPLMNKLENKFDLTCVLATQNTPIFTF